jgi:hypothetical protein
VSLELHWLTPREASIFACMADTVVAPQPVLPPVSQTDAVAFYDRWMGRSPKLNRIGFRALLYVVEVAPLAMGFHARMRRLSPDERARYLDEIDRSPLQQLRQLAKLVKGFALLSYYGDDQVMRRVGYDPDANLRRGRELRTQEGRL